MTHQINLSSKDRWFPTATRGFWNRVKLHYISQLHLHRDDQQRATILFPGGKTFKHFNCHTQPP